MKLQLKNLQSKIFSVEIADDATIHDLKEYMFKNHNLPVETQNLAFSGKVLPDDQKLKDAGLVDNATVIIFNKKKPSVEASSQIESQSQQTSTQPEPSVPPPSNQSVSAPILAPGLTSQVVDEDKITELILMGFDEVKAKEALQASFNNVEVAANFLMNGIPEYLTSRSAPVESADNISDLDPDMLNNLSAEELQQIEARLGGRGGGQSAAGRGSNNATNIGGNNLPSSEGRGRGGLGVGGGGSGGELIPNLDQLVEEGMSPEIKNQLELLKNHPQLPHLREVVIQQPHLLKTVIEQLVKNNPQLSPLVQQYPHEFLNVLTGGHLKPRVGGGGRGGGGEVEEGVLPGGNRFKRSGQHISVELSPQDQEKFKRIKDVTGADDNAILQVFFAFEKDENKIINFLFDN